LPAFFRSERLQSLPEMRLPFLPTPRPALLLDPKLLDLETTGRSGTDLFWPEPVLELTLILVSGRDGLSVMSIRSPSSSIRLKD
jgi:hypothetical protein